ncbi:MAG: tetratricopeptide repeat protein [Gemmatimonadales bacterium]
MRLCSASWLAPVLLAAAASAGCGRPAPEAVPADSVSAKPEAVSLMGANLYPRTLDPAARERFEADLAVAKRALDNAPSDADSIIWYGRRLGYLERYQDAIAAFSDGIAKHPNDSRMYRFRGHRYITVREFDKAIADLSKAAELIKGQTNEPEPDGAPNASGVPTSSKHGNIFYHLALAHYLKGEYQQSLAAWDEAYRIATNDDSRVSVNDWRYMTLRRLGRHEDAKQLLSQVNRDMNVLENTAYFRRLLMYKGEIAPDSLLVQGETDALQYVTQGYGVGNWYLAEGDSAKAFEIFDKVLSSGYWAAFGFIAAETDVVRKQGR